MAIQTKTFSTGDYAHQSWSNGYVISLTLTEESQDSSANTSVVSYLFTISNTNNNRFISNDYSWNIYIGGQTISIKNFDFYVYPYNVTQTIASGEITVTHDQDGKLDMPYSVSIPNVKNWTSYGPPAMTLSGTWSLKEIPTYTLSLSAGIGSTISVKRTSSGYAPTGNISSGARLYYGDNLKITFSPISNYRLVTTTVNGLAFTSGNTYTVTSDVSVVSSAQVLASAVGASNANIDSVSTITVTKYNDGYYHSLQYSFGQATGYITSSGGVQSTETKFKNASVPFTLPTDFYAQIPNSKNGICTITCRTYSSSSSKTQLGDSTTCRFTVTAAESLCAPTVIGTVVDINETTKALTGDENKLIRYRSTAKCTISATPNYSSGILSKSINDVTPTNDVLKIAAVNSNLFVFKATDSRGYTDIEQISPTMVSYIELTCNPVVYRQTPTGNKILLTVSGNIYRGSFGAYSNNLTLQYRYRESGGSYGGWIPIDSTLLTLGASSYRSTNEIELVSYAITDENGETVYPGFDYHLDYDFQVRATDGAGEYILSTVNKYVTVSRGVPVFDWGENDFAFHVPVSGSFNGSFNGSFDGSFDGSFNGSFNGAYIRTTRVSGSNTITIQSKSTDVGESQTWRQSVFLFGYDNGRLVYGVVGFRGSGEAYWSGTEGVSAASVGNGQFAITLPGKAYDSFVLISAEDFSIVT